MRIRVVGHERCRPGKTIYGLVDATLKIEQFAEVSMRIGRFRIDGDGITIGCFRLFEPALCSVNVAHVRARGGSRRVEPGRFSKVLERLVQPTALAKQAAQQIVRIGVIRRRIERFAIGTLGRLQVAGPMMLQAMPYSIDDFGVSFQGWCICMLAARVTRPGCIAFSSAIAENSIQKAHGRFRASQEASRGFAPRARSPMRIHLPRTLRINPLVASSMKSCS